MATDLEIARAAKPLPIEEVAAKLGLEPDVLYRHGKHLAKLEMATVDAVRSRPEGRLILVTAINPTPPGEGKTTTTVGLGDALARLGHSTAIALREPSLGPVFGRKGGATGGGWAQVVPMEDINLHFTGDFHAITAAHNLLAALIDNHLHWANQLELDPAMLTWRRVSDTNDRALRRIVTGLGEGANGRVRETGFDITVASEIMAIFCLATDLADLQTRLGRIVIGRTFGGKDVTAADLDAAGALAVLLKDAFQPNLVQTLEGTPAFVHGGPFANIAHGCNSVIATRTALKLADYVVTEAGFGSDLGAEKFLDIKCRSAGLAPSAAVIVATTRALKFQGGAPVGDVAAPNRSALVSGLANLDRHIRNMKQFGLPIAVAINRFAGDDAHELSAIAEWTRAEHGVEAFVCTHWADGGAGAEALAAHVVELAAPGRAALRFAYPLELSLTDKIETIARSVYGAAGIAISAPAKRMLARLQERHGTLPICIAKTPVSFSADESQRGAPTGFTLPIREVRLAAGAGFVVAICGEVMTMPGLPRVPGATRISLDRNGRIEGLS
jgi:formate--tetrahydrofolate ligase